MFPAVNCGASFRAWQHASVPDLQANAVCRAHFFSSQRRDGGDAANLQAARRAVQELHESRVLGIHLAELRVGLVGDDFAGDHSDLFFDEYL
jgi:hypothetical protein